MCLCECGSTIYKQYDIRVQVKRERHCFSTVDISSIGYRIEDIDSRRAVSSIMLSSICIYKIAVTQRASGLPIIASTYLSLYSLSTSRCASFFTVSHDHLHLDLYCGIKYNMHNTHTHVIDSFFLCLRVSRVSDLSRLDKKKGPYR